MGFVLEETTIREIHDAFRTNTLNCVSLTQRYLDRISTYDKKGPALNAFVVLNPNALAEATQLDAAFAKSGKFVGALHGIPIAVKDQAETFDGVEAEASGRSSARASHRRTTATRDADWMSRGEGVNGSRALRPGRVDRRLPRP